MYFGRQEMVSTHLEAAAWYAGLVAATNEMVVAQRCCFRSCSSKCLVTPCIMETRVSCCTAYEALRSSGRGDGRASPRSSL